MEAEAHESDDPIYIITHALKSACDFYGADWSGFLDVDLDWLMDALFVPDVEEIKNDGPEEYELYHRLGIRSFLAVPVKSRPVGFLVVRNPTQYRNCIPKFIGCTIDGKRSIYRVAHTVNTVPALHKRNKPKRTHDVIPDRCKNSAPHGASDLKVRCMDAKRDTLFFKPVFSNDNLIAVLPKIGEGELRMKSLRIGN